MSSVKAACRAAGEGYVADGLAAGAAATLAAALTPRYTCRDSSESHSTIDICRTYQLKAGYPSEQAHTAVAKQQLTF